MRSVFADSVGLLALLNRRDQWRPPALVVHRQLVADSARLLTTTYVLAECGNAAARWPIRAAVDALRLRFERDEAIIDPTPAEWEAAWAAYARGDAGEAGVVDHLSFQVMRRIGVSEAFTNDRHFAAAGFRPLF